MRRKTPAKSMDGQPIGPETGPDLQDLDAIVGTLRATGASLPEAVIHIRNLDRAPILNRTLRSWADTELREMAARPNKTTLSWSAMDVLVRQLLTVDSVFANAVFGGCAGLVVDRSLDLNGCEALTKLPGGLIVHGDLDLRNCERLQVLPEHLQVDGCLDLHGCSLWDGKVPETSELARIRTDVFQEPDGLDIESYLSREFWEEEERRLAERLTALRRHLRGQHGEKAGS